ncbi:hypothetical protein AB1L42_05200 [Thalassoglobus sp. JC818]|uniref:hypothetical protein n=1 Tax=Thalassoglobus sp. JC818 TaxID=3232136 RepID=UPI00345B4B45
MWKYFTARAFWILLFATFVQVAATPLHAELQVEGKPKWGLDGRVTPQHFNLLTVRVFNNSEEPWQGAVSLTPILGFQPVDVPVLQPDLYIEPYGNRDLQFVIYLQSASDTRLEWGPLIRGRVLAEDSYKIDEPDDSPGSVAVELIRPEGRSKFQSVPAFAEDLFPTNPIVLNKLTRVYLDHTPRWQEPQIQAFRDWLFAGGTVSLIADNVGEYPEFPASLSELNEPSDQFGVGSGVVERHSSTYQPAPITRPEEQQFENYLNLDPNRTIFSRLRAITTPEHNWPLIYTMATVYLLLLFPGCWLIGRKQGDYRMTYGVILATVTLFSFGFHSVGKRGYGEETSIHSVVLAQAGPPGRWIVKQWSNLFVTSGSQYLIVHPKLNVAYSSGQSDERIPGQVLNPPNGLMMTEVPAFSNRTIIDGGVAQTVGLPIQVDQLQVENEDLKVIRLLPASGQQWPEDLVGYAIYRNDLIQLSVSEGVLAPTGSTGDVLQLRPLQSFINEASVNAYNAYQYRNQEENPPSKLLDMNEWTLIAEDLGVENLDELVNGTIFAPDKVHVYLRTSLSDDFFAGEQISPQQNGFVIYSHLLHIPPRSQ